MHLVRMVDGCGELRYCRDLEKCGEDLNADREIPMERCAGCMLKWLQEAEPEMTAATEGGDTSSVTACAVPPSPQGEGFGL